MNKSALTLKVIITLFLAVIFCGAQAQTKKKERKKEFYFSWGYNKEWYTNSRVKISQPALGNNYQFINIRGNDHPGWDEGLFKKAFTIPQYNYRLGLFINRKKGLAVEINFDHTKFIFADQKARIKGVVRGHLVDSSVYFNRLNGYYYYLNNGANFLLFNIVKRWHLFQNKSSSIKLDALGKAGIGPVIPHVENSFEGLPNKPAFQIGGWNMGIEGAVRATFFNYVYLEFANKIDYARYSNLKIFHGTAKHAFGTYEMILNLGATFPVGKKL